MEHSYCRFVMDKPDDNVHKRYHDTQYGFALHDDNELFGRLLLEINQAGLSWDTILKKQDNFRRAYDNFSIEVVANYGEEARSRLLSDKGIIRNKLKVGAAIYNAQVILDLQKSYGSFKAWLDHHHPLEKPDWVKLFKKHFKFTGGEITGEFLMSTGYLPGAHDPQCPVFKEVQAYNQQLR